jgi:tRNA U34 5-methylaminomethyl-2-thiouridine-forming methyltransferase MnmC
MTGVPAPRADHEIVDFGNGTASLRPLGGPEAMHSSIGPWAEAREIYLWGARIAERLLASDASPLVIYDIGMGLAANALAALDAWREAPPGRRPLRIVSFESAPSGLATALAAPGERFPFLQPWRPALETLLERGRWRADGVDWELRPGDFCAQPLGEPAAELVFYDFYSPKAAPELWGVECFARVRAALATPAPGRPGPLLITYCASTSARAAMLLAGFVVGRGAGTAVKRETTLAAARAEDLGEPLDEAWLAKLGRSSHAEPWGWSREEREELCRRIRACPQFGARTSR